MNSAMSTLTSALKRWRWLVVPIALAVPYAALGYLLVSDLLATEGITVCYLFAVGGGVILVWLVNVMGVAALLGPPGY